MGGSGHRPSWDTVAALYGAVRRSAQMGEESPELFSTVRQDTIHHRHARLAGERLTVR